MKNKPFFVFLLLWFFYVYTLFEEQITTNFVPIYVLDISFIIGYYHIRLPAPSCVCSETKNSRIFSACKFHVNRNWLEVVRDLASLRRLPSNK